MMERIDEDFVIPISVIGPVAGISNETVRRIVRNLEDADEIEVLRTPTGRGRLNIPGYRRVSEWIRGVGSVAAA